MIIVWVFLVMAACVAILDPVRQSTFGINLKRVREDVMGA